MSEELVTIGGQQFVFHEAKGWIDKKTGVPANENLLKLLNAVSPNRSTQPIKETKVEQPKKASTESPKPLESVPVQGSLPKVKTKKVNGVDPIVIGGERYIYTNKGWVDEKTKSPIPEKLKALFGKLVPAAKEMGAIGQIEAEKIQKKDKEKIKKPQQVIKPRINKMFVRMITELSTIDSILSARLKSVAATNTRSVLNNRENLIESMPSQSNQLNPEAEEAKEGGSSLVKIGGIVAITALLATQFDPLYEQVKALWDVTEKSAAYVNGFAEKINGFLSWFVDTKPKETTTETETKVPIDYPKAYTQAAAPSPYVMKPQEPAKITGEPLSTSAPVSPKPSAPTSTLSNSNKPAASKSQVFGLDLGTKSKIVSKPAASAAKSTTLNAYTQPAKPNLVSKPAASSSNPYLQPENPNMVSKSSAGPMTAGKDVVNTTVANGVPRGNLHQLRKWLQSQGFRTSEQKGYDPVGKHMDGSRHYSDGAIDVNIGYGNVEANNPEQAAKMDVLASQLKDAGYGVVWRAKGHYNHLHVDTGKNVNIGGGGLSDAISEGGQAVVETAQESWKALLQFMKAAGKTDTQFRKVGSNRSNAVEKAASFKNKKIIESKNKKEAPAMIPELPNLNMAGGTVKLPSSSSSSEEILNQYMSYFGQN